MKNLASSSRSSRSLRLKTENDSPRNVAPHSRPRRALIIIPERIALRVVEEASLFLDYDLPRHWTRQLTQRAYVILDCNADFRRKIERGNTGRDLLWSFMRHWLCAIMAKELPDLHRRLPSDYNVGRDLPPPPPVLVTHPRAALPDQRPATNRSPHPIRKRRPFRRVHGLLPVAL